MQECCFDFMLIRALTSCYAWNVVCSSTQVCLVCYVLML